MSEDVNELNYEDEESDFDLDDSHFDMYQQDVTDTEITKDFLKKKNVEVNHLKSKFTPAQEEIKQISELKGEIRKALIGIIAHESQPLEIRRYYGLLKGFYISFKTLIDGVLIQEVDPMFRDVKLILKEMKQKNKTPPKVYEKLTQLTEALFKISQYKGLGLMVEKTGYSNNARKRIVGE